MKIIIVSKQHGQTRSITLGGWTRALLSVCLLGIPVATGGLLGYNWLVDQNSQNSDVFTAETRQAWEAALAEQQAQVKQVREQAQSQVAALTLRMAELQARLVRLDALGEHLTAVANLEEGEFDFSQAPALGGPETVLSGDPYTPPDFISIIDQLSHQIENREQQLAMLDELLVKRKLQEDIYIAGRPIKKGWMSSRFGRRTDPFSGRVAYHNGVDFAAKEGSEVIAVGAGVVTASADRQSYGFLVEINHGGGIVTRYAHNKKNLVNVGDVVKKGQVIALVGSTGRSTGPHVHFEVHKNGRAVDPATYIHRASR
ncbi:peptidoglycan DD-metalloendopeptidase family protein [Marinimicrobium sp. ABcell2]|uniref:peptidoglycan DD-metalloendopeptidase family protein n=1 Tax=Marinimicrobium sp. ABcell2 TaxID=3069751 RepID=UPI0027B0E15A|nr:peptidoglycan DD-metalloendopeptidase family protein [Marinimicrobium sp. ABcell2]MDQ2075094.1 peptidoglycan DD-metalloendopeptidase family protein [Marinimicrobium sp. ABcell2]